MSQVYRGNPDLVHVQDGQRALIGSKLADHLDFAVRRNALDATDDYGVMGDILKNPLCPGCYMVVLFNAAIATARRNGQSLSELGNSLGNAFLELARTATADVGYQADARIEEIEVRLDSDPCPTSSQE